MFEICEYNDVDKFLSEANPAEKIELHDITMRDGAHVVDFSSNERVRLASELSDLGIKRIEIESRENVIKNQSIYPPEDHWKTLKDILNMGLKADIYTMRNIVEGKKGIDEALKLDINHIVYQEPVYEGWLQKLNQKENERLDNIKNMLNYAKDSGCYIVFFHNHIGKSNLNYLIKLIKLGIECEVDSFCITDSEGICSPLAFKLLTQKYVENSNKQIPIEIHAHNDYGLALANSITSYLSGASVIQCSVNGLGSRAGNTILEEVIISLHNLFNVNFDIKFDKLFNVCKTVEYLQQWPVAKNKPFYGYGIKEAPYKLEFFGKKDF